MTDASPSSDVRFDAFLSYSQRDMDVVRRVQSFLEDYPIGKLMGRDKCLRIYRDETDTRGGDLTDELMTALGVSGCLILCRSKNTDQSVWVTKEVAEFARLEPERPIISLRLDDHSVDKVPPAIRDRELLHLDLRDGWLLGRPRERTRIDLMRALAQIGGVELRQLIPWDRQRQRRLWMRVGALGAMALAAMLLLGFSAYVENRNAHYVDLRSRGDRAILSLTSGNRASGVASLARVIAEDKPGILNDYRELYAAWQPSLDRFDKVLNEAGPNRILDLSGDFYVNTANGLRRIETSPPFIYAVNPVGKYLAITDYRGAFLYSIASMALVGDALSQERFRPEAIYHLSDDPAFLVTGSRTVLTNSEDEPVWIDTCYLILRTTPAAPSQGTTSGPIAETEAGFGSDASASSGAGEEKPDALKCLGTTFAIDRVAMYGPSHLLLGGRPSGYYVDNDQEGTAYLIDLETGEQVHQSTPSGEGSAEPPNSVADVQPANLPIVKFPRKIPESHLWRRSGGDKGVLAGMQSQVVDPPVGAVAFQIAGTDFSAIEEADFFKSSLGAFENPPRWAFARNGQRFYAEILPGGNSWWMVGICAIGGDGKAERCSNELGMTAIRADYAISPNRRFIVNRICHSGEGSLQLIDIAGFEFVPIPEIPKEIVAGVAFDASSGAMAALTENDVLWVYDLAADGPPRLMRRIRLSGADDRPAVRFDSDVTQDDSDREVAESCESRPVAFLDSRRAVGMTRDNVLFAVDTQSGEIFYKTTGTDVGDIALSKITTSPNGRFFALHSDKQVQLYHGGTGAPLSEAVDIATIMPRPAGQVDLDSASIEEVQIENDGSLSVETWEGQRLRRLSGLADAFVDASLAWIELQTGLDAQSGTPITDPARLAKLARDAKRVGRRDDEAPPDLSSTSAARPISPGDTPVDPMLGTTVPAANPPVASQTANIDPGAASVVRCALEWTGDYEMFDSGNRSLQLGSKTIGVYVGGFQSLSHDLGIAECFGQLTRTEKRSFFDFKPLSDYAGLPLYSSRQGSDERSDTVNYYNPELIRWLFEEFLPSPDAELIKSLSYRSVYQIVFRPGVRLLAQTYHDLQTSGRYEPLLQRYRQADKEGRFAMRGEFRGLIQSEVSDGSDYQFHSGHAVGFWMRRGMDDTAEVFWQGLLRLLDQYDPDFRSTLNLP